MKSCSEYVKSLSGEDMQIAELLEKMHGAYVVDEGDIKECYPARARNTHKGSYGSACVIAGSEKYLGAAALSVSASLRSGCGYVYALVPQNLKYALAVRYPQCIYCDGPEFSASAIAVGMGLGNDEHTYNLICSLLESYKGKLIIDADGLNALATYGKDVLKHTGAQVLITPHMGEMARLCNVKTEETYAQPLNIATDFAREYGVCVHLKSAVSLTCGEEGAFVTVRGNTALAKAGSGDMLSGLICGNAARGISLAKAAVCSQYVLGVSAELCVKNMYEGGVTADEIIKNIPVAVRNLT